MATHQKKHMKKRFVHTRELLFSNPEEGETYGQIVSAKGDARFEIKIIKNNSLVIAKARGILIHGPQKKRLIKDDYVLIQSDNLSYNDKYYIIHKYSPEDVKKLKKSGELATMNDYKDDNEIDNNMTNILFDEDVLNKLDEIEINDDFIASI
jgi:translation initiation factor IF-1